MKQPAKLFFIRLKAYSIRFLAVFGWATLVQLIVSLFRPSARPNLFVPLGKCAAWIFSSILWEFLLFYPGLTYQSLWIRRFTWIICTAITFWLIFASAETWPVILVFMIIYATLTPILWFLEDRHYRKKLEKINRALQNNQTDDPEQTNK